MQDPTRELRGRFELSVGVRQLFTVELHRTTLNVAARGTRAGDARVALPCALEHRIGQVEGFGRKLEARQLRQRDFRYGFDTRVCLATKDQGLGIRLSTQRGFGSMEVGGDGQCHRFLTLTWALGS